MNTHTKKQTHRNTQNANTHSNIAIARSEEMNILPNDKLSNTRCTLVNASSKCVHIVIPATQTLSPSPSQGPPRAFSPSHQVYSAEKVRKE
jgi:hypothetical protein